MENKKCRVCGVIQPLENYTRLSSSKDGHSGRCKSCDKQVRKETEEYQRQYQKQYVTTERGKEVRKNWFQANPDNYVYKIENTITGMCYIGSTKRNIASRWSKHQSQLIAGTHYNALFQSEWDTYGHSAFKCDIIESVPKGNDIDLSEREKLAIDNAGSKAYNIYYTRRVRAPR